MNFKKNETVDKLRGGYYTPPSLAQFLLNWVMQANPTRILEPSCGDGVFLDAIHQHFTNNPTNRPLQVDAIELLGTEAEKASRVATRLQDDFGLNAIVHEAEFLSWINHFDEAQTWDGIIGNPPYIRYQYFDQDQRCHAEALFRKAGIKFTKRTNAWVPFVIASIRHLSPNGRLAMVLPAELLHIMHAHELRQLLESQMSAIDILDIRELAFENALQGVLLFRGIKRNTNNFQFSTPNIRRIDSIRDLDGRHEPIQAENLLQLDGEWTHALLNTQEYELLQGLTETEGIHKFVDVASVDIGIVTGANNYFVVNRSVVERYNLENITSPMLARSEFMEGIIYTAQDQANNEAKGKPVLFLEFPNVPKDDLSESMRKYIELGEEQELHKRYKTSIRDPWYVVPYVWTAELSLLKRCHFFPKLVLNEAQAYSTDTAYRIRMNENYRHRAPDLVFSFLNSLTFLTAELSGRYYGGGVLELVPSEVESLLVRLVTPTPEQFATVDRLIRENASVNELLSFTDPIILGDLLTPLQINVLRDARERLQNRRLRVSLG